VGETAPLPSGRGSEDAAVGDVAVDGTADVAGESAAGDATADVAAEAAAATFPFWGLADVFLFLGLALPVMVVAISISYVPMMMIGVESKAVRLLIPQFIGYAAAMLPLWLIFRSRYRKSPLEALRLGVSPAVAVNSVPAGVLAAIVVLAAGALLRAPKIQTPMEELLQDPISIGVVGLLASTIGPVFEELFFRGLLQPVLARRLGVLPGIVIAALPFALLHGPQYAWSWRHIVLITFAGSLFGWRRFRTGSTGAAAIMHAAYNLTLFIAYVAGRSMERDFPQSV
jgi:membrane protease YdiL (CAAX protease family)